MSPLLILHHCFVLIYNVFGKQRFIHYMTMKQSVNTKHFIMVIYNKVLCIVDCFIVAYCSNAKGMTHITINSSIFRPAGCWHTVIYEHICCCTVWKTDFYFSEHHLGQTRHSRIKERLPEDYQCNSWPSSRFSTLSYVLWKMNIIISVSL
jgi:hypothetical protein